MQLKYACTALVGTGKKGELKPDANGYYRLCLGGLNIYNSAGIWYDYESSKHLFDKSSSFMRRMSAGNLYSEEDHPQFPVGGSFDDYVLRIKRIDPKNICAHLRGIELVSEGNGRMMIYGDVRPDRERGAYLKAALDNPDQNVCFSIRALCDDQYIGGRIVRTLTDIITFDWVVEPGISKATKYNSPALESFHERDIPISAVESAIVKARSMPGIGMESAEIDGLERLVQRYRRPATELRRPGVLGW